MIGLIIITTYILFISDICYGQEKEFTLISYFNNCEGSPNSTNFILVESSTTYCDLSGGGGDAQIFFVQTNSDQSSFLMTLQSLERLVYFVGAYLQGESLSLITSGPLQGNYIYSKAVLLHLAYLKKCSSVLGYSFVTTKSRIFLVNKNLDFNVLLSPLGAFESFRKGSYIQCKGVQYAF